MSPSAASCCDEGRIVLLFAGVEAGVFQQQHVAVLQRGDGASRRVADAVVGEGDRRLPTRCASGAATGFSDILRIAALGPAEMRRAR